MPRLIQSMEAVIGLLVDNYRTEKSYDKREDMLNDIFFKMATAADAWQKHSDRIRLDELVDKYEDLSGKDMGDFAGMHGWVMYMLELNDWSDADIAEINEMSDLYSL